MSVKTIKGVADDDWKEFKVFAAQNRVNAGAMFRSLIEAYKKEQSKAWSSILNQEKILSDEDARKLNSSLTKLRKERGFRV
jgi:argininosuccinate lyase